jgi:hypothetical protein
MFEKIMEEIVDKMSEDDIRQLIFSERQEYREGLSKLAEEVKSGKSTENVIAAFRTSGEYPETFLRILNDDLKDNTSAYIESTFLREMDFEQFKSIIEYAVENIIIRKENNKKIIEDIGIDNSRLEYLIKFINTANDYTIIRRFTQDNFLVAMNNLFRLNNEKVIFIWDVFEKNESKLVIAAFLGAAGMIRRMSNSIDRLNELIEFLITSEEPA